ncbi:MAG: glycosyltransferase family 2 protein [Hymenobacter sp.]|nr:MAG: glycosyltransferase family 2 protein [Hymenobacter sp.]
MKANRVSIVIPTYKRPVRVLEAIGSCLGQTHLPYEVLIGDDSPDDATAQAISKLAPVEGVALRYMHNQPSLGQVGNVNNLFHQAQGELVMLLHDDDLLLPESLATLTAILNENPDVSLAYGRQYIIEDSGNINPESSISFNRDFYRDAEFEGTVLTPFEAGLSQQIPNNGYLMRAEIPRHVKLRTEAGDGCDYDFGFQIGLAGYRSYFVNKYLGMYRLSAHSISHYGDAGYQSYCLMRDCKADTPRAQSIRARRMYERAPIAITECAVRGKKKEALAIYFSRWYRSRMLSLGGIKRILYILFYVSPAKLAR